MHSLKKSTESSSTDLLIDHILTQLEKLDTYMTKLQDDISELEKICMKIQHGCDTKLDSFENKYEREMIELKNHIQLMEHNTREFKSAVANTLKQYKAITDEHSKQLVELNNQNNIKEKVSAIIFSLPAKLVAFASAVGAIVVFVSNYIINI